MFQGFSEETVGFFWGIRFNNSKAWFEEHRSDYTKNVYQPMREFASEIEERFVKKHPEYLLSVKVSRINRDARRLFGRGPYRDNVWISIFRETEEHTDRPSFWFDLGPEELSYGMGFYAPKAVTMAKHRARIDKDPSRLKLLSDILAAQDEFKLYGDSYKKSKGGPEGNLGIWYNLKSVGIGHDEPVGPQIEGTALADRVIAGFEFLLPYYDYFASLPSDPEPVTGTVKGTDKTK